MISALVVDNPEELKRIIKNMRRNKFKKELKKASEIKANKSSYAVKTCLLEKLNSVNNAKVYHIILEKKRVSSEFLVANKHKLYNFIAGKLAKNLPIEEANIVIKIDKSKGSLLLQKDFNIYFENKLKENCKDILCNIQHSYSHAWAGLQFADMLAWACFQKYERNNEEYLNLIKIEQEFYLVWN